MKAVDNLIKSRLFVPLKKKESSRFLQWSATITLFGTVSVKHLWLDGLWFLLQLQVLGLNPDRFSPNWDRLLAKSMERELRYTSGSFKTICCFLVLNFKCNLFRGIIGCSVGYPWFLCLPLGGIHSREGRNLWSRISSKMTFLSWFSSHVDQMILLYKFALSLVILYTTHVCIQYVY